MFVHSRHLFIAVIQRSDSFPADGSSIFSRLNDHSLAVNSGTKYQAKWIGVQTSRQSSRHFVGQGENRLHSERRPLNAWRGSGSGLWYCSHDSVNLVAVEEYSRRETEW